MFAGEALPVTAALTFPAPLGGDCSLAAAASCIARCAGSFSAMLPGLPMFGGNVALRFLSTMACCDDNPFIMFAGICIPFIIIPLARICICMVMFGKAALVGTDSGTGTCPLTGAARPFGWDFGLASGDAWTSTRLGDCDWRGTGGGWRWAAPLAKAAWTGVWTEGTGVAGFCIPLGLIGEACCGCCPAATAAAAAAFIASG